MPINPLPPPGPSGSILDQWFYLLWARISRFIEGFLFTTDVVTGTYTVQASDQILLIKNTANCTVTLPDPATCVSKRFTVKKANANVYSITVIAVSGDIDDATSQIITDAYTAIDFVSDGTDYWII